MATKVIKEIVTDVGGNTTIEYSDDTTQKYNVADVVTAQSNPLTGGIELVAGGRTFSDDEIPAPSGFDDTAMINAHLSISDLLPAGISRCVTAKSGANYIISGRLIVRSGTTLNLTGATITSAGTNHEMIVNKAFVDGGRDKNISIIGGTLIAGSVDGNKHRVVVNKCDGVTISAMDIRSTSGKYAILIADVSDFEVSSIHFDTISDGVHVTGPALRGSIHHIYGTTGDDFVALGCSDYLDYDISRGDICDVSITDLYQYALIDGGNTCKLFVVGHASIMNAMRMDRISVERVYGQSFGHGVLVHSYATNNGTFGKITIRDVSVKCMQAGYSQVTIDAHGSVSDLTICDVTIPLYQALASNGVTIFSATPGLVQDFVRIENISDGTQSTHSQSLIKVDGVNVKTLSISGLKGAKDAGASKIAITVTNSSVIDCLSVSGFEYSGSYLVRLVSTSQIKKLMISSGFIYGANGFGPSVSSNTDIFVSAVHVASTCTFILLGGASATLRGSGFTCDGSTFYRGGSEVFTPYVPDFKIDLSKCTKSAGAMAYNTNAGLSCGLGVCISDGAVWKNLVSGTTY